MATEEPVPASSTPDTGDGSHPPNHNNNNSNNNNNNSSSKRTPRKRQKRPNRKRGGGGGGGQYLQAQQTKITVRNIVDVDRYGTVHQILDMIRLMIKRVNEEPSKLKTKIPVRFDEASMDNLIRIEALTNKEESGEGNQNDGNDKEEKTGDEVAEKGGNETDEAPRDPATPTMADVVKESINETADLTGPCITARALYVVPPKKSRRRGILGGCAYLVLTAPVPTMPKPPEGEEATPIPQAEKSRITAVARLQLLHTIEAITSHAARQQQQQQDYYGGCRVAASISGKAWKDKDRRDRREGTIENAGDFKQFMAKQAKAEEERKSRPKPTPGGGVAATVAAEGEKSQKTAAIVLHLRARREEQKRRQKAKKKSGQEKKDRKQQTQSGGGKEKGRKGGRKRKDGNKKNQGGGGGGNKQALAPSVSTEQPMLLMKQGLNGVRGPG